MRTIEQKAFRLMTLLMVALFLLTSMPVQLALAIEPAAPNAISATQKPPAGAPAKANRHTMAELTKPIIRQLTFSSNPNDSEFFSARVFREPLVPMDLSSELLFDLADFSTHSFLDRLPNYHKFSALGLSKTLRETKN